jgi:tetratricopeptide (TPR) repeat protein
MDARYDVFVSHTWAAPDLAAVRPLTQALHEQGLRVFIDDSGIDTFARITPTIIDALAASKVLLAFYSAAYPKSKACQWELTAAYLAAQRAGDPAERVLVVNPEPGFDHLHPGELRDAVAPPPPAANDHAGLIALANAIAKRTKTVQGPLGAVVPPVAPRWLPDQGLGWPRFVDRLPELWQLHTKLHPETTRLTVPRSGPAVALVQGLGGVGKTLLALEYALRFGAAYPGGVFWLRAYGSHQDQGRPATFQELTANFNEQVRKIAEGLELSVADRNPQEVRAILAAKLHERGQPCLWVVDDLPDGLDVPQVQSLLAPDPVACTLLTTRSRRYDAPARVDLDVLPPDDALALLTSHRPAPTEHERTEAGLLVADLGRHALAVEIAGAALRVQAGLMSFAQFRAALRDTSRDELELAAELAEALPGGHEASIAATLRRSLRSLGPAGSDVLRLAAVLATAPVPLRLIAAVLQQADGLDEQVARDHATSGIHQAEMLSLATQTGLGVDPDTPGEPAGEVRWEVHALVARTVRLSDPQPQRSQVLRAAAVAVLTQELAAIVNARAHAALREVVPHARELALHPATPAEAKLLGSVARYDYERGHLRAAQLGYQQQRDALRQLFGPEHPDTLRSMSNLADTLRAQGELAGAFKLHEQVLGARWRLLGLKHPDTLSSTSHLANTLYDLGVLDGARDLHRQVLDVRRQLLGPEHPDTLSSMSNLAETLRALGKPPEVLYEALKLHQQVLNARRRLDPEHLETLTAMNNLAATLQDLGDLAGARDLFQQVVAVNRRLLGAEHPDTLRSINNLAMTLLALEDLAGARELQEEAVNAYRRLFGPEHSHTVASMHNLATTLYALGLGELVGAHDLLQQVVIVRLRRFGPEHPATRTAAHDLALVQRVLAAAQQGGPPPQPR